jgi:hypothetical protein
MHPNTQVDRLPQVIIARFLVGFSFVPEKEVSIAGDREKSGTIRPAKDDEFIVSSPFLTLPIITMSRWHLSNKKL